MSAELSEAVHKAKEEEIQIPFGVGVAGTVAETKQVVNIRNAYQVTRVTTWFSNHICDDILFKR